MQASCEAGILQRRGRANLERSDARGHCGFKQGKCGCGGAPAWTWRLLDLGAHPSWTGQWISCDRCRATQRPQICTAAPGMVSHACALFRMGGRAA